MKKRYALLLVLLLVLLPWQPVQAANANLAVASLPSGVIHRYTSPEGINFDSYTPVWDTAQLQPYMTTCCSMCTAKSCLIWVPLI